MARVDPRSGAVWMGTGAASVVARLDPAGARLTRGVMARGVWRTAEELCRLRAIRIETDTPLPTLRVTEVAAGGDCLWVAAPFEDQTLDLRRIVEGDEVRGWWNLGVAEQGVLRGHRVFPETGR